MKLNLGSGINCPATLNVITLDHNGWKHIDICKDYPATEHYDISTGIREPDGSVEEIFMGDSLEHFLRLKSIFVIKECFRVLKPGGQLRVSVPDMAIVMPLWLECNGENTDHSELIWGDQDGLFQKNSIPSAHFHGYTEKNLKNLLLSVGFKNINRIKIHGHWCELAVEAYK